MITEAKSMEDYFVQLCRRYVVKSYWPFWFIMIFLLLTVVDCGTLTSPENGSVSHTAGTTFRQTATYSCDKGYNLVGSNTHTCQATGFWSWNASNCQGVLLKSEYWVKSYSCSQNLPFDAFETLNKHTSQVFLVLVPAHLLNSFPIILQYST